MYPCYQGLRNRRAGTRNHQQLASSRRPRTRGEKRVAGELLAQARAPLHQALPPPTALKLRHASPPTTRYR